MLVKFMLLLLLLLLAACEALARDQADCIA